MKIKFLISIFFINFNFYKQIIAAPPPPPVLSSASVACNGEVTVSGSGAVASTPMTVFADLVNIGNSASDASGNFNFSILPNPLLTAGPHSITVTQTSAGEESGPSNAIIVQVVNCNFRITSPQSNSDVTTVIPQIRGIVTPNTGVTVFARVINIINIPSNNPAINGALLMRQEQFRLGATVSNSAGNFVLNPITPLLPGEYFIFAVLTANPTIRSNVIRLNVRPLVDVLSLTILNKYECNE